MFADPAAGESRAAPDPAEAKKQEHLQKIRQLTFDRRPSAILKAWSTPRDEAIEGDRRMPRPVRRCGVPSGRGEGAGGCGRCGRQSCSPGRRTDAPVPAAGTAAECQARPFDQELKGFQYDVTLGDWPAVKAFLAKLPKEEGKAAYEQLIQGLSNPPGMQGNTQMQNADANADADADEHGHALRHEHEQRRRSRSSS